MNIRHIVATCLFLCTICTVSAQESLVPRRDNSESIGNRTRRYKDAYIVKLYLDQIAAGRDGDILLDPDNLTGHVILIYGTWPSADGDSSNILQTDGNGTLYWGNRTLSDSVITHYLQVISGANDGYYLRSDASGNATWTAGNTASNIDSSYIVNGSIAFVDLTNPLVGNLAVTGKITASDTLIGNYIRVISGANDGYYLQTDGSGRAVWVEGLGAGNHANTHEPGGGDVLTLLDSTSIKNGTISNADLRNDVIDSTKVRANSIAASDIDKVFATDLLDTVAVNRGGLGKSKWFGYAIPSADSAGTAFDQIAIGAAGQYLKVNATANGYSWDTGTTGNVDSTNIVNSSVSFTDLTMPMVGNWIQTGHITSTQTIYAQNVSATGNVTGTWAGGTIPATKGGTNKTSWFGYAIPSANAAGNDFDQIAIGAANQFLVVNGTATGYSWIPLAVDSTAIAANSIAASDINKVWSSDLLGTVAFGNGGLEQDLNDVVGIPYFQGYPQSLSWIAAIDSNWIANGGVSNADLRADAVDSNKVRANSIAASDIDKVFASDIIGIVPTGVGGTGIITAPANGQLLIGNMGSYTLNALNGTANEINIQGDAGSITIGIVDPLIHEKGGLEADVSAYAGLVKISVGATTYITDASANWNTAYNHTSLTNNPHGVTKTQVGLGSVENTALSTWSGSGNISTLGTIGAGTWNANTIGVSKGGTGATTFTTGAILYMGATVIQGTPIFTNGQLFIGDGSGAPTITTLTEGEGIDIANGAGSITLSGEDASTTNKGIASFNSSHFTTSSGAISLEAGLGAIAGLAKTDGNFIVGNGTTWVAESGVTARTSLGIGTLALDNRVAGTPSDGWILKWSSFNNAWVAQAP